MVMMDPSAEHAPSDSMVVNCVVYSRHNGQKIRDIPLDDISEWIRQDGMFVWVGLHEPDQPLMQKIQAEFGLHELAVEDAYRAHQRPKLEEYGDTLFVAMHTARLESGRILYGETHVFVGSNFVVTVRHGASLTYALVRQRAEHSPKQLARGPGYVLYSLMDFVVDNYFPVVDGLKDQLHAVENEIFAGTFNRNTIRHLYERKRELVKVRLAVSPLMDICNQLMHLESPVVPEAISPYFRDVYDHILRISDAIDSINEMLSAALEVNLALVSVGQNEVVKRLASWAGILAVPTMIASFYGMNFEFMPELKWHWGYPFVLALMFGVSFGLYRRLRRAGWL